MLDLAESNWDYFELKISHQPRTDFFIVMLAAKLLLGIKICWRLEAIRTNLLGALLDFEKWIVLDQLVACRKVGSQVQEHYQLKTSFILDLKAFFLTFDYYYC